jgi:hypothetical protein
MSDPTSVLTKLRPDIWRRGLGLLDGLAPYQCPAKQPLDDGTIYACCYSPSTPYVPPPPPLPPNPEEIARREREQAEREVKELEELLRRRVEELERYIREQRDEIDRRETEIDDIRKRLDKAKKKVTPPAECGPVVCVPEGAMEWLLHEAGHWVAASDDERMLPNYGLVDEIAGTVGGFQVIVCPTSGLLYEREWQAWAFEEIVLAPFGPARSFAPPTQRDGVAYAKAGSVPAWALAHVERRMRDGGVDVDLWRSVFGEWVHFESGLALPSWRRVN